MSTIDQRKKNIKKEWKKKCDLTKKEYLFNEKKQKQLKKILDKCKKESFKYGKTPDTIYDLLMMIL